MDPNPESQNQPKKSPYEASWISRLLFLYMSDAMTLANERVKEGSSLKGKFRGIFLEADVYHLPPHKSSDIVFDKFWNRYLQTESIFSALAHAIGCAIPGQIILLLIFNLSQVRQVKT